MPSSTVQGKMTWTSLRTWLQVLASPSNGLLFWTPVALPALCRSPSWLASRRRHAGGPGARLRSRRALVDRGASAS